MNKVAIIEDDQEYQKHLYNLLFKQWHSYQIDCFSSGEEFIKKNKKYGATLLDIRLPGIDGIALAKRTKSLMGEIVYLTGDDSRMKDAFDDKVIMYILKSENEEEIIKKLKWIYCRLMNNEEVELKVEGHLLKTSKANIVKIQRENRKIYLYLDKKSFTLSGYTLENLKNLLGNEFEYANQSCLINIPHISLIKNEQIYLDNNSVVYLSRSYKNSFMKKFLESAFR